MADLVCSHEQLGEELATLREHLAKKERELEEVFVKNGAIQSLQEVQIVATHVEQGSSDGVNGEGVANVQTTVDTGRVEAAIVEDIAPPRTDVDPPRTEEPLKTTADEAELQAEGDHVSSVGEGVASGVAIVVTSGKTSEVVAGTEEPRVDEEAVGILRQEAETKDPEMGTVVVAGEVCDRQEEWVLVDKRKVLDSYLQELSTVVAVKDTKLAEALAQVRQLEERLNSEREEKLLKIQQLEEELKRVQELGRLQEGTPGGAAEERLGVALEEGQGPEVEGTIVGVEVVLPAGPHSPRQAEVHGTAAGKDIGEAMFGENVQEPLQMDVQVAAVKTTTSEEVAEVKTTIADEVAAVKTTTSEEVAAVKNTLEEVAAVKTTAEEVVEVKTIIQDEVAAVKTTTSEEVAEVKTTTAEEVAEVKTTTAEEVAEVKTTTSEEVAAVKTTAEEVAEVKTTTSEEVVEASGITAAQVSVLEETVKFLSEQLAAEREEKLLKISEVESLKETCKCVYVCVCVCDVCTYVCVMYVQLYMYVCVCDVCTCMYVCVMYVHVCMCVWCMYV